MGEKDIAQKNFEAYNDVVADIVNGSLFDGREIIKAESLVDAQPFSQYKAAEGIIHELERDVAKYCMDMHCNVRLALVGFENQMAIDWDMPIRVIGYDGISYRDELNQDEIVVDERTGRRHKVRGKRYPVITLVLYFGARPWKKPLCLYDVIDVPEVLKPFVNDFKLNLIDVPRLTPEQVKKYKGDFQIIADYFVQQSRQGEYVPLNKPIQHPDSFLKLMSVLTRDKRYSEVLEDFADGQEGVKMCEVLDRVEARGEARGRAAGELAGAEKSRVEMIQNMLKENISIEVVAKVARMTVEQVALIGKKAAIL
ncbi:Rpn family recombination-promoting nuclease/putative transposase [Anaerovibrio sp.]|nr:Rpn family recombination-promoting nuclease/putative transposase [Anaerovibrio sp.]MDD6598744.1 Rpn family recombination-promoting nuclease/putative transposase [Anaerovibrio sp.]